MAVVRIVDRRLQHVGQAHRSEPVEDRNPAPEQTRDDAGMDPLVEGLARHRRWVDRHGGRTGGAQRVDPIGRLVVDRKKPVATRTRALGSHHMQCRQGGHRGVGGVSSLELDSQPGHRRQRVTCRDRTMHEWEGRPVHGPRLGRRARRIGVYLLLPTLGTEPHGHPRLRTRTPVTMNGNRFLLFSCFIVSS